MCNEAYNEAKILDYTQYRPNPKRWSPCSNEDITDYYNRIGPDNYGTKCMKALEGGDSDDGNEGGGGGSCTDENPNCKYWASIGECQKSPAYMMGKCKQSCECEFSNSLFLLFHGINF